MHVMYAHQITRALLATPARESGAALPVMCAPRIMQALPAIPAQMPGLEMLVIFALLVRVERAVMFV